MNLSGHWQTILPALFRCVPVLTLERERLELDDGDFLDLQWHRQGGDKLLILSHGLEGSANASYIQGMARAFAKRGWDILAWNCRSCSGEMNRLKRFYHSGVSGDLDAVIKHALASHEAEKLGLIGFSLGGNVTLKYLGEKGENLSARLVGAVAFSVPCDLASSSERLSSRVNQCLYMRRFIKTLIQKVREKSNRFPGEFDLEGVEQIRTFKQFDDRFTAPLHGFNDAEDYWQRASSRPFFPQIRIPTLLVQAKNDPFLGAGCFPYEESEASADFQLEVTETGGHVGFGGVSGHENWAESRAARFFEEL